MTPFPPLSPSPEKDEYPEALAEKLRDAMRDHDPVPLSMFHDDELCDLARVVLDTAGHAELLTSLQALYDACELRANKEGGDFGEDIGPAAELAEAALAKARGE